MGPEDENMALSLAFSLTLLDSDCVNWHVRIDIRRVVLAV